MTSHARMIETGKVPNHPKRWRCFVIVSRQASIDSKAARVLYAPVNTTYVGPATHVPVDVDEGLKEPSCINCDQLFTVGKSVLTDFVAALSATKVRQLRAALRIALAVK